MIVNRVGEYVMEFVSMCSGWGIFFVNVRMVWLMEVYEVYEWVVGRVWVWGSVVMKEWKVKL